MKRGRKKKYTDEQLKAMRRIWNREANRRWRASRRQAEPIDRPEPRPPTEVIMERDYRHSLAHEPSGPPPGYTARYAQAAEALQAKFAIMTA